MISKGIAAYLDTHGTISGHWRPGKRQPQPSTVILSEAKDLRLLAFLHQNNNSGCPPSPTASLIAHRRRWDSIPAYPKHQVTGKSW